MQRVGKKTAAVFTPLLLRVFFDFHNFLCRCGDNFQSVIAHTVKQGIELTPLRILYSIFVRKEKLIYRYGITGNKLIEDLQARLLSLVFDIRKVARR